MIEGTTDAPIEGARITILDRASMPGSKPDHRSADTQLDGSFVVGDVPAGKYIVSADKEGYVDGSSRVTITGAGDVNLRFSLVRTCSLSGRVVDGDGKGVPGVRVGAWAMAYRFGRPWVESWGFASTGKDGDYQIGGLRRGVYLVGALPASIKPSAGNPPEDGTHVQRVYARSFYPDAPSLAEATGIPLEEEQQLRGVDIPMQKANGYCVTASLPEWASRGTEVSATIDRSGSRSEPDVGTGVLASASRFYFCGVPSGEYILYAVIAPTERTTSWVASVPITLDKRDTKTGALPLEEAKELNGQILVDKGQLINQRPPSIGLQLEPVDRWPLADEDVYPRIEGAGRFVFRRLYSGRYWVDVTSISSGYYVSQISAGARDGMREPIQLGEGGLTVTVRSDGPALSGTVTTENGRELPGSVTVVLAGTSGLNQSSIRSTRVDQAGRFSFDNLAPGKFNLLALSGLSPEDAENPLVISRFASQAKELDLAPHSSQQVELHPIPAP